VSEDTPDDPLGRLQDLILEGRPAARVSLAEARDPRAAAPGPDAESLRSAYLDLLKLSLCDLAGTTTISVGSLPGGGTASRLLRGDQRRLRVAGMDWPLQGLTMTGLARLEDLQLCVETVVRDGVEGDLIEAGVWRGGASILMRAALDALGDGRTVWVADSFQGFPRAQEEADPSEFDFLAVPLEEVRDSFARFGLEEGVRFVKGFFEETLPPLSGERWAIVRLDADTYEATWTALQSLYPALAPGGYLIIDDYGVLEECRRAVDEFRAHNGIAEEIEEVDWSCVRWRRESSEPIAAPPEGAVSVKADGPVDWGTHARGSEREVPTLRELALTKELEELRARLAEAERQLGELRSSRIHSAAEWVRQRRPR
jgi:O-methyltransferase